MKKIILFDNLKGIMIICVVISHLITKLSGYYGFSRGFFKIFGFFMLPVFLFITGYLTRKSKKKLKDKVVYSIKLYILVQTLAIIYYYFIIHTSSILKFNYLIPKYTLWYLIAMVWIFLYTYILRKVSWKIMIPITLLFSLLIGFTGIFKEYLGITRTVFFMPFYVIGYYDNDIHFKDLSIKYSKKIRLFIILFTIFFLFKSNLFSIHVLLGKYEYLHTFDTNLEGLIMRVLYLLISFIFTGFFLGLNINKNTIFSKIGKETLIIYITQGMIIKTIIKLKLLPKNVFLGIITSLIIIGIIDYIIIKVKGLINERKIFKINEKSLQKI